MPTNLLSKALTEKSLRRIAGATVFDRGSAYADDGAVMDLVDTGPIIKAKVQGSDEYRVRLWTDDGELCFECTCPYAAEDFCKHAVAVGLVWLKRSGSASGNAIRKESGLTVIDAWLQSAPRETLVSLLNEQAENDADFRHRLQIRANRERSLAGGDVAELKDVINKAFAVSGFVDWRAIPRVCERIASVAELLTQLVDNRHPAAYELAHRTFTRGLAVYQRTDDSAGRYGDELHGLAQLLLRAAQAGPPAPNELAKRLFKLLLADQWGLIALEDYKPLLGEQGWRVLRGLAEKEWARVPARGSDAKGSSTGSEHSQITTLMEELARIDNDTDALIEIKSRDLSLPYRYLEIAEILARAKRRDEALEWAERGHKTFKSRPDSRLIEFLANEYARRKRHDDAVRIAWEQFQAHPSLSNYQFLKHCADRVGVWAKWRNTALAHVRESMTRKPSHPSRYASWIPPGHSLLVEVFLWEGDSDAALAEARTGGCSAGLWYAIAKAREGKHPAEAAEIYRARIDDIVRRGNNGAYDEAVASIVDIERLMTRSKQQTEWMLWIEGVRARHKAKRNFIDRLNRALEQKQ